MTIAPLRRFLADCQFTRAAQLGWQELKNGILLSHAEKHDFDVMVTCDQSMQHHENLSGRRIALVVLETNDFSILKL